ncbi:MAG: hypothetical protein ACYDIE_09550 [Candidatus Krumholzibacteriia bacterium]
MTMPLPYRGASVMGALLAILAVGGCGGAGVGDAEAPAAPSDPSLMAAAALAPVLDALHLALDTGRFAVLDAPGLLEAGADQSDSLIVVPGRGGLFTLAWFDADHDGRLSSGDGLRLDAARRHAPPDGARPTGLHVPELTFGAGAFATPALYADLVPAEADSSGTSLSGTLTMAYARGALGERLTAGCGTAGLHCVAPGSDAVLDSLDLTCELQPYSHAWTLQARASVSDARFGTLTLQTTTPLRGALRPDGSPGPVESGRLKVRQAGGGSVAVLFTGPDRARLRADEDGDGIIDQNLPTSWAALLAVAR